MAEVIHVAGGHLTPCSPAAVEALRASLDRAWDESAGRHLLLHFHGGLVNRGSGLRIALALGPVYAGVDPLLDDTTPTGVAARFIVWETGLLETVTNNLGQIAQDPLFREVTKKAAEWTLKRLPGALGVKGGAGASVDEYAFRAAFDDYFQGRTPAPPAPLADADALGDPTSEADVRGRGGAEEDDEDLDLLTPAIEQDIAGDLAFQDAVAQVAIGLGTPAVAQTTRGLGTGTTVSATSLLSPDAAARLFPPSDGTLEATGDPGGGSVKGAVIDWIAVAREVAAIVRRVVRRQRTGRAHGLYVTVVEEVLRSLYVDKLGGVIWNTMKQDTADAFAAGPTAAGTAILAALAGMAAESPPRRFGRITLVGHSTGAVYICNLIDAAAAALPDERFEVVFLAPAVRCSRFAETLAAHGAAIAGFRQFAMSDGWEAADRLVPIIYPRSLLYFVSGLLEWTAEPAALVDEPLVGMQRFAQVADFPDAAFPACECVRAFLDTPGGRRAVWAPADDGPGLRSHAAAHGDFDDERDTLRSVVHLLRQGF